MIPKMLGLAVMLAALAGFVAPVVAQDVTAEVRTWNGQAWRLSQPSLEVFYTLPPQQEEGGLPVPTTPPGTTAPGMPGLSLQRPFGQGGPEPLQGHRQSKAVTFYHAGIARQIPLSSIAALAFTRHQVTDSTLPPYVALTHLRYSASAVLTDGNRVDGDYVNWGTAVLRGATPAGRVDIPWQDIEVLRFSR